MLRREISINLLVCFFVVNPEINTLSLGFFWKRLKCMLFFYSSLCDVSGVYQLRKTNINRTETKGNILKRVGGIVNRDRKKRCPLYARKASRVPHFSRATFFNGRDSVMITRKLLKLTTLCLRSLMADNLIKIFPLS